MVQRARGTCPANDVERMRVFLQEEAHRVGCRKTGRLFIVAATECPGAEVQLVAGMLQEGVARTRESLSPLPLRLTRGPVVQDRHGVAKGPARRNDDVVQYDARPLLDRGGFRCFLSVPLEQGRAQRGD